jgi:hypothetical protein
MTPYKKNQKSAAKKKYENTNSKNNDLKTKNKKMSIYFESHSRENNWDV